MEPARVHITAYGCQMNRLDAELVRAILRAAGAEVVEDPGAANVLLFLTCSVRAHAEDRVFSNIGALAARKQRESDLVIGLLGCTAQQYGERVWERAPLADVVCGPGRLAELPALIDQARAGRRARALDPRRGEAGAEAFGPADSRLDGIEVRGREGERSDRRAFVRATRGCDMFCSYCVVPYVRGPERSRPPRAVTEEVRRLVDGGVREVTLLGQAVNRYAGEDGGHMWDLADLLAEVAATPGLTRLRFITSHPTALTPRLASVFRDVPAVCPHLHMPAQSGSDAVLARMNRGYTAADYLDRLAMVREAAPEVAVASDFIVGFPGESEADFEATLDLVRRARFAQCFVFKYSPRPGTTAARRYVDDAPPEEKRRRNQELLNVVSQVATEENQRLVGREVEVLVEGPGPRPHLNADGRERRTHAGWIQWRGRTRCHRLVVFDGPPGLRGKEVTVRVERAAAVTLFALFCETTA